MTAMGPFPVGTDGSAILAPAPLHLDKARQVESREQIPRPWPCAHHHRNLGGEQCFQAGQAHADIAYPIGKSYINDSRYRHQTLVKLRSGTWRLAWVIACRPGNVKMTSPIVYKRVNF